MFEHDNTRNLAPKEYERDYRTTRAMVLERIPFEQRTYLHVLDHIWREDQYGDVAGVCKTKEVFQGVLMPLEPREEEAGGEVDSHRSYMLFMLTVAYLREGKLIGVLDIDDGTCKEIYRVTRGYFPPPLGSHIPCSLWRVEQIYLDSEGCESISRSNND